MAASTCEGSSLPLAQAEPVETAQPSLSSFTTQRCWPTASGISAETVFQTRACPAPTISEPGRLPDKPLSKWSRRSSRDCASPAAKDFSRTSNAASIESTPATFSVPARRPSSCLPPSSSGLVRPFAEHFKKPTPFGPPNLCAHPLTKSQSPKPTIGSLPIHCAASQKKAASCSWQIDSASRQGCTTPVSLLTAIMPTSAGGDGLSASFNQSNSIAPA